MKSTAFWILDACVLFSLSLLYLYQGYHRKNQMFTLWLCFGVFMQLVAAWGLAAGWPKWIDHVRAADDVVTYLLTAGVLVVAAARRDCPVNRSLLWGVGGMVALNLFARAFGTNVPPQVRTWLRNIAFFGPAIFLLIAFSNLRLDRLPLWIDSMLHALRAENAERTAFASISVAGTLGAIPASRVSQRRALETPRHRDAAPRNETREGETSPAC
ncbi:MAG TPA: hypothetical protein VGW33_15325 [Terriglobia bacterium]|nr:hypothetical protein [Terriglobia bacterium]